MVWLSSPLMGILSAYSQYVTRRIKSLDVKLHRQQLSLTAFPGSRYNNYHCLHPCCKHRFSYCIQLLGNSRSRNFCHHLLARFLCPPRIRSRKVFSRYLLRWLLHLYQWLLLQKSRTWFGKAGLNQFIHIPKCYGRSFWIRRTRIVSFFQPFASVFVIVFNHFPLTNTS